MLALIQAEQQDCGGNWPKAWGRATEPATAGRLQQERAHGSCCGSTAEEAAVTTCAIMTEAATAIVKRSALCMMRRSNAAAHKALAC